MATFAERLRSLRNSRDLSQAELAKLLKLSKSSINMYERGEREPSFETLESIADLFNVDMNFLMGQSDIERAVSFTNDAFSSPASSSLLLYPLASSEWSRVQKMRSAPPAILEAIDKLLE